MTIENLTIFNWKGVTNFRKKNNSNKERVFTTKRGIKKLLVCYEEILRQKKKNLTPFRG